jgi:hypothetical protein
MCNKYELHLHGEVKEVKEKGIQLTRRWMHKGSGDVEDLVHFL